MVDFTFTNLKIKIIKGKERFSIEALVPNRGLISTSVYLNKGTEKEDLLDALNRLELYATKTNSELKELGWHI